MTSGRAVSGGHTEGGHAEGGETGFRGWPDLASRALSGSVVWASDELFAQRENLIRPGPALFSSVDFGHKGKIYDGWETRRRRDGGEFDAAIVRLGVPGIIHGVVIDTAWFTGNYPPFASVEATGLEGYPSPEELADAEWVSVVERSVLRGDSENPLAVADGRRFTHVRLTIYPDGGVARFRVHGEPVPDPRFQCASLDLAALENGGDVVECSDMFYSSPRHLLAPGAAGSMADGWENARRRDDGHDFVTVRLAARGTVDLVEVDTSYFVGNAPGAASLSGADLSEVQRPGEAGWVELVGLQRLQPDTRHLFRVTAHAPVTHVRLDVFPDGGVARLRVTGSISPEARRDALRRWLDLLPTPQAIAVLSGALVGGGQRREEAVTRAQDLAALRPFSGTQTLPDEVAGRLLPDAAN
ncbi:allantoicase [Lapillicoccus sp.]|uniref:allantoicase n=1 Tax=Lapillicoccus sp. TaxID=1909287 RepID=UPI0039835B1A